MRLMNEQEKKRKKTFHKKGFSFQSLFFSGSNKSELPNLKGRAKFVKAQAFSGIPRHC